MSSNNSKSKTKLMYEKQAEATKTLKNQFSYYKSEIDFKNAEKSDLQSKLNQVTAQLKEAQAALQSHATVQSQFKPKEPRPVASVPSNETAVGPNFVNKAKQWKAGYNLLKDENKYLKATVQKLSKKLSKKQSLHDLMNSSCEESSLDELNDAIMAEPTLSRLELHSPTLHRRDNKEMPIPFAAYDRSNHIVNRRNSNKETSPILTRNAVIPKPGSEADPLRIETSLNRRHIEEISPISTEAYDRNNSNIHRRHVQEISPVSIESQANPVNRRKSVIKTSPDHASKAAFRTSGLIPPPPRIDLPTASSNKSASRGGKLKRRTRKLKKFVNGRNSHLLINHGRAIMPRYDYRAEKAAEEAAQKAANSTPATTVTPAASTTSVNSSTSDTTAITTTTANTATRTTPAISATIVPIVTSQQSTLPPTVIPVVTPRQNALPRTIVPVIAPQTTELPATIVTTTTPRKRRFSSESSKTMTQAVSRRRSASISDSEDSKPAIKKNKLNTSVVDQTRL